MKTRTANQQPQPKETPGKNVLTIDYGRDLEAMIKAGKYEIVSRDIRPASFPKPKHNGIVRFEFRLVKGDEYAAFVKENVSKWKHAQIEHLLALGEAVPKSGLKKPVLALGSDGREAGGFCGPETRLEFIPMIAGCGGSDRSLTHVWRATSKISDDREYLFVRGPL